MEKDPLLRSVSGAEPEHKPAQKRVRGTWVDDIRPPKMAQMGIGIRTYPFGYVFNQKRYFRHVNLVEFFCKDCSLRARAIPVFAFSRSDMVSRHSNCTILIVPDQKTISADMAHKVTLDCVS